MRVWRIDYVVGNTYKVKFVKAKDANEAVKKSRIKNPVDVQLEADIRIGNNVGLKYRPEW